MQKAKVLCIVVSFENIYESDQGFHNGTMAYETSAHPDRISSLSYISRRKAH